jgi:hypothetical protein
MQKSTITITLSQAQRRDSAMRLAGVSPQALAIKPGIRVERNRRHASRVGYLKHKSRSWD